MGELLLPERCIGCGAGELSICELCRSKLRIHPELLGGENFHLAASLTYDDLSAKIILAAKEDGVRAARTIISEAIAAAAIVMSKYACISEQSHLELLWVPTSKPARRRRGGDFLAPIAAQVALIIERKLDVEVRLHQPFRVRRNVADQSRLSATDRDRNLQFAFTVHPSWKAVGQVILIDDVVTTGSTLREAVRALQERNLTVIGAATACASRLRKPIR